MGMASLGISSESSSVRSMGFNSMGIPLRQSSGVESCGMSIDPLDEEEREAEWASSLYLWPRRLRMQYTRTRIRTKAAMRIRETMTPAVMTPVTAGDRVLLELSELSSGPV